MLGIVAQAMTIGEVADMVEAFAHAAKRCASTSSIHAAIRSAAAVARAIQRGQWTLDTFPTQGEARDHITPDVAH